MRLHFLITSCAATTCLGILSGQAYAPSAVSPARWSAFEPAARGQCTPPSGARRSRAPDRGLAELLAGEYELIVTAARGSVVTA